MAITAFVVKVLGNQTDLLLEKIINKFSGSTHTLKFDRINSNKINNDRIIKDVS